MATNDDEGATNEAVAPWERNFREQMIRTRETLGMTQTQLARRLASWGLPFHQQTVQRVEAGQRPVRLNEAHLIARELGLDLETMTTTATPNARGMMLAVDEMRRGAELFKDHITEDLGEWADTSAGLILAVDELLKQYDPDRPDPILRYGYTWAMHAYGAYESLVRGLNALIAITEGREGEAVYMYPEFDTIEGWGHPFDDEWVGEFPKAPANASDS